MLVGGRRADFFLLYASWGMLELQENTLVIFVSDTHIGGDPGCDGFESPEELERLFEELAEHDGPVELVLAGDFFDFLQIGAVPEGMNRASLTIVRPEYEDLFAALRRFREGEGKRVIYLPGNHDAEAWWNPEIQETLIQRGLVDEFSFSYLASVQAGGRRVIYCEHGNQLDPPNTVEDYRDPLDTPLGHHVVMDFTRRVAPYGEVAKRLDLSEIKNVYPLVAIPQWLASRYFYNFASKVISYLLLPLLVAYLIYRVAAHMLYVTRGDPARLAGSFQELPAAHLLFTEITGFGVMVLLIFAVFFLIARRAVRKVLSTMSSAEAPGYSRAELARSKVRAVATGAAPSPMAPDAGPMQLDVFISGHTHLPSLEEVERADGGRTVVVNSGCWLRQLQPVTPHLKGPPVFVSRFVLTYVRVLVREGRLEVELCEWPKPAAQSLTRLERLISWNLRPPQPPADSKPRVRASSAV